MEKNELYHYGVLGMKWGVRRARKKPEIHDDYRTAHTKKSVKSMSNKELQDRNKRLNMEKQYRDLTKKTNRGKKIVQSVIATAGTLAAAESAYRTYKKYGDRAIDKLGDFVMEDLSRGLAKPFY